MASLVLIKKFCTEALHTENIVWVLHSINKLDVLSMEHVISVWIECRVEYDDGLVVKLLHSLVL